MFVLLVIIPFVLHTTLADNTYTVTFGDSQKQCVKCPPGSYVVKDCGQDDTYSTICGPCPTGRYAQAWNAYRSCKPCRTHCYGANEIITTECQPDHDIICGCPPEFWRENHGTPGAKCLPFLKCGKGDGVDKPGSNISDVTCTPCISGVNYSSVESYSEVCKPCRDCQKEGWNQTQPCTVFKDAECDVKTSPKPTTTRNSKSSTKDTRPTTDSPSQDVTVIVCVVVIVVLAVLLGGFGLYRYLKSRRKKKGITVGRNHERNNPVSVIYSCNGAFESVSDNTNEVSRARIATSSNSEPLRRRISNLSLRSDVTLENDVFPWLGRMLGNEYQNICKSLPGSPGNRIVQRDIDDAKYTHRCSNSLADVIAEVFLIWKQKNSQYKEEDDLFREVFNTLDARKDVFSAEMREEFLSNFT